MAKKRIEGTEGNFLAMVVKGMADVHYGYDYRLTSSVTVADSSMGKRKLRYAKTAEQRAKLAKTKFDFQGIVFNSRKEVASVMRLFEKRFGSKMYIGRGSAHGDIRTVLNEVRKK